MSVGLFASAGVALVIVWAAYRARSLSMSGAVAAFVVGTLVLGCGGVFGGGVLLAFFISSSLWTRVGTKRKHIANVEYAKGGNGIGFKVWPTVGGRRSSLWPAV